MNQNQAVLEVEQNQEQEPIVGVGTGHTRMAETSFSRAGVYATTGGRSAFAVSAAPVSSMPILLTIAAYGGAVCIGAWASLNLLRWFWQQLQ